MNQIRASRSRRIFVPMALACLGCAALLTRVVYIQVVDHERLAAEAQAELHFDTTFYGRRGAILDRNGDVLATSVSTWDLYVQAREWVLPETALAASQAIATALKAKEMSAATGSIAIAHGDAVMSSAHMVTRKAIE